ncbi:hypothetical protein HON36_01645 [Candidatus Parcubacteria bacterium]|jgi:hypothetical protein|nr:hypothetical protein [Candidatus Parcubacteria bacterium]MBT7228091.1 hypothetical protein [Candidatus Parcubacteria bacterium]
MAEFDCKQVRRDFEGVQDAYQDFVAKFEKMSNADDIKEVLDAREILEENIFFALEELSLEDFARILHEAGPNYMKIDRSEPAPMTIERTRDWVGKRTELDPETKQLIFTIPNLDLTASRLTRLPKNLKVLGNLNLYRTAIKKLPRNLTVTASLSIVDTGITELPDTLRVGVDIYVNEDLKAQAERLQKNGNIKGGVATFRETTE